MALDRNTRSKVFKLIFGTRLKVLRLFTGSKLLIMHAVALSEPVAIKSLVF